MKKAVIIYNPVAGRGTFRNKLCNVVEPLNADGYEVLVRPTTANDDITDLVKKYVGNCNLLICSGGDGTLANVINGLMEMKDKPVLGYIPAGSTNDFASTLKISPNVPKAVDTIINGKEYACDIGKFNDQYFVYVAAFGLFTEVSYATDQNLKNRLGHAAYIIEAIKSLQSVTPHHMKVEYDGNILEKDFLIGMICNTTSIGGFKPYRNYNIELDDGLFEVLMIENPPLASDVAEIMAEIIEGDKISEKYVHFFKTSNLKITSTDNTPWTLDGEFGGSPESIEIVNRNKEIKIMIPKQAVIGR